MDNATIKILRRKQVEEITGLSRSTIYAEVKAGNFPRQHKLTAGRAVGWLQSEIESYLQSRSVSTFSNGAV